MNQMRQLIQISLKGALLVVLAAAFVLAATAAVQEVRMPAGAVQYALVDGNVKKPGFYKVSEMTNNLDLLKKAGLTDSSDIAKVKLTEAADPEKTLEVGVTRGKIAMKTPLEFANPEVRFYLGGISLRREMKVQELKVRTILRDKDMILTRNDGKAKIGFMNLAEMNVNINSRLGYEKMTDTNGMKTSAFSLENGQVWVKVPKATTGSQILIRTLDLEISTRGEAVEFLVMVTPTQTTVQTGMGNLYVRNQSMKDDRLIKEEVAVVAKRNETEITEVAQRWVPRTVTDLFGDLEKQYVTHNKSLKETSFLFMNPNYIILVSILPEKGKILFMDLPGNTYVGDYMSSVFRLDQALALTGIELSREISQRVVGRPIKYVVEINYTDIIEFAYTVDGLMINVDNEAARYIGLLPGYQRLQRQQLVKFLYPHMPGGPELAVRRQKQVLQAFLEEAKSSPTTYVRLVAELLRRSRSNVPINDGLATMKMYLEKDHWNFMKLSLPTTSFMVGDLNLVRPDYEMIQAFYN